MRHDIRLDPMQAVLPEHQFNPELQRFGHITAVDFRLVQLIAEKTGTEIPIQQIGE